MSRSQRDRQVARQRQVAAQQTAQRELAARQEAQRAHGGPGRIEDGGGGSRAHGYVGGGGIGDFAIVYGYRAFEWEVTVVATLIIIVLVQAAQFFGNWLSSKVMRR